MFASSPTWFGRGTIIYMSRIINPLELLTRKAQSLVGGGDDNRAIDTSAGAKPEVASCTRHATPMSSPPLVDEEPSSEARPSPEAAQGRGVRRRIAFDTSEAGQSASSRRPSDVAVPESPPPPEERTDDNDEHDHRGGSSAAEPPAPAFSTPPAAPSPAERSKEPAVRSPAPPHGHPRLTSGASTPPDVHYKKLTFGATATPRSSPTPTRCVSFADELGAPLTHTTWIPRRPNKEEAAQEAAREARAAALEAITPSVVLSKMLDAMYGSSSSAFPPTLRAFR